MGEVGETQGKSPDIDNKQERKAYKLKIRGPLFDYIADGLAPVYRAELAELRKNGAFVPIKEFFASPFGTVMTKIMDIMETSPKRAEVVEFELLEDEYKAVLKKMPEGADYFAGKISHEMMGELRSGFGDAKLQSRLSGAVIAVKNKLRGKKH